MRARPLLSTSSVGAALTLLSTSLAAQTPHPRMQEVMDRPEFVHASWGLEFYDLESGQTVFGLNRERLFVPGSTTKLVTMGTALEALGAEHRFRTRVYRTGPIRDGVLEGDLVLVASGDPNLSGRARPDGTYAFVDRDHSYGGPPLDTDPLTVVRDLARQVAAAGIRTVSGQVLVDATLFAEGDRDLGTRVALSPLMINDNVIDIVVTPGAAAGAPASVRVSPQTSHLTVFAQIATLEAGSPSTVQMVEDSTNRDHRTLVVTGGVPMGEPLNPRWTVPVPSRFGEIVLAEVLADEGVRAIPRLASRAIDWGSLARSYHDSLLIAEHVSLPLIEEATVVLKTSQNVHASNLPLLLGSLPMSRDSAWTGFDVARRWLEGAGLNLDGAVQGDGAGGDAYFSPAFMTRYLAVVADRPWGGAFEAALPVLGRDGTLVDIQPDAPAAGKVFAKTGTYGSYDPLNRRLLIHGKGLAGYFTSRSGRRIAFALYLNNFAGDMADPAAVAGQALGEIAAIGWEVIR